MHNSTDIFPPALALSDKYPCHRQILSIIWCNSSKQWWAVAFWHDGGGNASNECGWANNGHHHYHQCWSNDDDDGLGLWWENVAKKYGATHGRLSSVDGELFGGSRMETWWTLQSDTLQSDTLQSDTLYGAPLTLPNGMLDTQVSCVMSKFIQWAALNKDPRPIFCVCVIEFLYLFCICICYESQLVTSKT